MLLYNKLVYLAFIVSSSLSSFSLISKPAVKIVRAHLFDRKDAADHLLKEHDLTLEQFTVGVIGERDHCVLALSSENKSISTNTTIIKFDNLGDDPLFQRSGFSWRYEDAEIELLQGLVCPVQNRS